MYSYGCHDGEWRVYLTPSIGTALAKHATVADEHTASWLCGRLNATHGVRTKSEIISEAEQAERDEKCLLATDDIDNHERAIRMRYYARGLRRAVA